MHIHSIYSHFSRVISHAHCKYKIKPGHKYVLHTCRRDAGKTWFLDLRNTNVKLLNCLHNHEALHGKISTATSIILVPIPGKGTRWYQCCCWRTVTQKQTGGHTLVSRTPWTQILSLDAVSSCYTCVTKQGKNYAQSRRSIFLLLAPLPSLHALTQTVQLLLRSWCTSWRATLPWAAGTAVVTSFTGI